MAKLKVFVIHDAKVGSYGRNDMPPFYARTKGEASRTWIRACNDPQTMMCQHPEDFALFEVAEYDDATGRFDQHETLIPMGTALEAKSEQTAELRKLQA